MKRIILALTLFATPALADEADAPFDYHPRYVKTQLTLYGGVGYGWDDNGFDEHTGNRVLVGARVSHRLNDRVKVRFGLAAQETSIDTGVTRQRLWTTGAVTFEF